MFLRSHLLNFNSRPHGGRPGVRRQDHGSRHFNSRPHGGRRCLMFLRSHLLNFNSRPHGGRPYNRLHGDSDILFQLTPSRRATGILHFQRISHFISTHALTEGDVEEIQQWGPLDISTHALTEGDHSIPAPMLPLPHFNSRPHGGRQMRQMRPQKQRKFQLTPSRRATLTGDHPPYTSSFQLTPSRRATIQGTVNGNEAVISTHALTEGDIRGETVADIAEKFQLTPSRRATEYHAHRTNQMYISTHALTEGDAWQPLGNQMATISTHALTEGDTITTKDRFGLVFQLTPSRRATRA